MSLIPGRLLKWAMGGAAAIALALGVWLFVMFTFDMQEQRARISSGSRVLQTRCGAIELAEAGEGPPVLIVHGTGGGFDQGLELGADLARHGLRVIAPSRFGYLRTPYPSDASAQAQADQFVCLLDELAIERVALIGASAGANSAIEFAIRHPDRTQALILLVPATYKPRDMPASAAGRSAWSEWMLMKVVSSDFLLWFASRFAHDAAMQSVLATPIADYEAATAEERRRADRLLNQVLPISLRAQGLLNDARIARDPPPYALELIRAPTLIFSTRNDLFGTYASAQYTVEHIRGARFVGYERGGHLSLDHHQEVVEEIAEFIQAIGTEQDNCPHRRRQASNEPDFRRRADHMVSHEPQADQEL